MVFDSHQPRNFRRFSGGFRRKPRRRRGFSFCKPVSADTLTRATESLEDRTLLTHVGPYDLGDGLGPKFIGGGLTVFTEDFSDNPNHEDPATVPAGFDDSEAQGDRQWTHTITGSHQLVPITNADIPFDQAQTSRGHVMLLQGTDLIEFLGVHPDYHVAAVSVDMIVTTPNVSVDFIGVNGQQITLGPAELNKWNEVLVTRGTIVPGTTDELGPIRAIRIRTPNFFGQYFDNVKVLIDQNTSIIPNQSPTAVDDLVSVLPNYAGQPINTYFIDVLANDYDVDLSSFELVSATDPDDGTVAIVNGQLQYTPEIDFHGEDHFDYVIRDDEGLTDIATVHVTVNTPPTISDLNLPIPHGATGSVVVTEAQLVARGFDADGDPLTPELFSQPTYGTVVVRADGSFEYTPNTPGGLVQTDTFQFRLFDGFERSGIADVRINAGNQVPVAQDILRRVEHGTEGWLFDQFVATDADGDPLTYELVDDAAHGEVKLLPDGRFGYQPEGREYIDWGTGIFHPVDRTFRGPDSFTYRVVDSLGASSAVATVRIDVPNHAPVTNLLDVARSGLVTGVDESYNIASRSNGPGTADLIFSNAYLTGPSLTPASGRLRVSVTRLTELNVHLDLFQIENVVEIGLYLDGIAGPQVASLYSASPGSGRFAGGQFLQSVIRAGDLLGPLSNDFSGFLDALHNDRIYVNIYTNDGVPIFNNGMPVESGPGDFFISGEINGRIRVAGEPTHFAAPGPLWNDNDLETLASGVVIRDPLRMIVIDGPIHGTLLFDPPPLPGAPLPAQPSSSDGSFTYFPDAGFEGLDSFTYVATDGWLQSPPTIVRLDVKSAEYSANLRDDVITLESDNDLNAFGRIDGFFDVRQNDLIPPYFFGGFQSAAFQFSSYVDVGAIFPGFYDGSPRILDFTQTSAEFDSGFFVGSRHFTYALYSVKPESPGISSNFASIRVDFLDRDHDGDGLTDSEEGVMFETGINGNIVPAWNDPTRHGDARVDSDNDGVNNLVEGQAPNNGDGNADGILDIRQRNVTSLKNGVNAGDLTFVSPQGTVLQNVQARPRPGGVPAGVSLPIGLINFEVNGVFPGLPVTVEIILHDEPVFNNYYKFGPTTDNLTPHWYEFLYDGTTGAELIDVDGDGGIEKVVLHLLDGERGDDDSSYNGTIVDPGAPAYFGPPSTPMFLTHPGTTHDHTPTISWTPSSGAESYELLVYDVPRGRQVLSWTGMSGTSTVLNVAMRDVEHQVFVRAVNNTVVSEWAGPLVIELASARQAPPAAPKLFSPDVSSPSGAPEFVWSQIAAADVYELLVYNVRLGQEVLRAESLVGSSFTPTEPLTKDRHQAFVRAISSSGTSAWSGPRSFDVLVGNQQIVAQPGFSGPPGPSGTPSPTFRWNPVAAPSSYELLVYHVETGKEVARQIVDGDTHTFAQPFQPGQHQAFVRANDGTHTGIWSNPEYFSIAAEGRAADASIALLPDFELVLAELDEVTT